MKKRAAAEGRDIGVYTTCHVVCRPTQKEAEDYYEHYAVTMADNASVDHYMGQKQKFSGSHDDDAYRLHRKRFAAGAGTYPLVGTPAHIADELVKISEAGFAGTTVSFVNFKNELPYFIDTVLPLLQAGRAAVMTCSDQHRLAARVAALLTLLLRLREIGSGRRLDARFQLACGCQLDDGGECRSSGSTLGHPDLDAVRRALIFERRRREASR